MEGVMVKEVKETEWAMPFGRLDLGRMVNCIGQPGGTEEVLV